MKIPDPPPDGGFQAYGSPIGFGPPKQNPNPFQPERAPDTLPVQEKFRNLRLKRKAGKVEGMQATEIIAIIAAIGGILIVVLWYVL